MKKFVVILLALLMLFLAGCSGKPADNTGNDDETTSPEKVTDTVADEKDGTEKKIVDFFEKLSDDYTVKEALDESMTAVFKVPDFYKLSKLDEASGCSDVIELIELADGYPEVVKEIEITVSDDEFDMLGSKVKDAVFFDMMKILIGSIEVELSDPAERTETEVNDESN